MTRQNRISTRIRKRLMVKAMELTLSNVSLSVKKARISRATHYRWMNEDILYKNAIDEQKEINLDFVEMQLRKLINQGNITAIIFHLKTQGRHRGYF